MIESLFKKGKVQHVDKTICGNGFSTGFLKLKPRRNKANIIVAPNKAVIISKEEAYKKGELDTPNKIKFFYKESDSKESFDNADILFFVADSFVLQEKKLREKSKYIDRVLLDEYHSTQIQSSFRDNLVNFINQVQDICSHRNTSIVTVTASPNLFSEVDVQLIPNDPPRVDIIMGYNVEETVERIREDMENDVPVVLCTNHVAVLVLLSYNGPRKKRNKIRARYIVGETFERSLYESVIVEHDEDAPLTVVSSKGFEGFDIHYDNAHVYFFEDRAQEFSTFYLSNLYQAISRTRKGADYIEYCRQNLDRKRNLPFKNMDRYIQRFIDNKSISPENKQKLEHQRFHPYVTFQEEEGGIYKVLKNQAAIDLIQEKCLYDYFPEDSAFDEFCKNRNIHISQLQSEEKRKRMRATDSQKIANLLANADIIRKRDVYGEGYRISPEMTVTHSAHEPLRLRYFKKLNEFIRRKDYDQQYEKTERQLIAIDTLKSHDEFTRLLKKLTRAYNERSIEKYGYKDSKEYRTRFKENSERILCKLCILFARDFITIPPKWIAHRDYNLLVEIGMDEINLVSNHFGAEVLELDVKTCYPRIIYAMCGLPLDEDIYGFRKRNKIKVNVALNDIAYRPRGGTTKKFQKRNQRSKLKKLGINPVVINYLLDNYFEPDYRGDLFNRTAYYEKRLISKIRDIVRETGRNDGFIRRHDSLIVFNNDTPLDFINDLEYLSVKGWFDIPKMKSKMYSYNEAVELVEKSFF